MSTADALADAPTLADFVAAAWDSHPEQPGEVAAGLRARAATLAADDDAAEALRLAEHVWLSHLNDRDGLAAFLSQLPTTLTAAEPTATAVQRARWVLAVLGGEEPPPVADAVRWRGMQNLWTVWAANRRAADATAMLLDEAPRALAHAEAAARRALAASCNNLAAELRTGVRGDAAVDALMLAAADASAQLWRSAGTWVHAERADYQLAHCHAVLGRGPEALRHAGACLAAIDAHADDPAADAFERFFAHEALAFAHHAAGDAAAVAGQRARMLSLRAEIGDASLLPWCDKALAEMDAALR